MVKDFFELEISRGGVVAPSHPDYFHSRFYLFIRMDKGSVEVEDKGYTLDIDIITEIKDFMMANIKTLAKLSREKEEPFEGGEFISIFGVINEKVFSVSNYIDQYKFLLFEKNILYKIEAMISKAIATGNAYVDKKSPDPVKDAEEWVKTYDTAREDELKRHSDFLKSKMERRATLLKRLKSEEINSGNPLVYECEKEVIIDPRLYNNYENYVCPTVANKFTPPKKVQELTIEEIAKQFIFFNKMDYHNGGYSSWIEEDGQDQVFVRLFERYVELADVEAKLEIEKYDHHYNMLKTIREMNKK